MAAPESSENEGAKSAGIDARIQRVTDGDDDGVGPLEPGERLPDLRLDRLLARARDQVNDHLRVRGRLEEGALLDERLTEFLRIREVPVVGDREVAAGIPDDDRLRVLAPAAPGGRVADVADGAGSGQRVQVTGGEGVRHESRSLAHPGRALGIDDADACRLLAAVLEGVESEEGELGHALHPRHAEDPALLPREFLEGRCQDVAGRSPGEGG